ncbi:MAG: CARF domain-containing protein [Bacillota bacterium]
MDILLSAVGTRDPYAKDGSEGPILTAIKKIRPEICFLFGTDPGVNIDVDNTYQNALGINKIFQENPLKTKIVPIALNLSDPTNYKDILTQFEKHFTDIFDKYKQSKPNYYVNISSGTAQMHSSLLVLINSGRIKAKIIQVRDPKFVLAGEERIHYIDVKFLEEENYLRRAKKLFERYDFKEASEELAELASFTIRETREKRALTFALLLEGYDYWDKYDHKKALECLESVLYDLDRFQMIKIKSIVSRQIAILSRIIYDGDKETYYTLNDLLHNAWRRKYEGRYIDCLMRYKRLIDGLTALKSGAIGYKEMRNQPKWIRDILNDKKDNDHLYYTDFLKLYRVKNKTEMLTTNIQQEIKNINLRRNECAAAHGMGSVSEKDAFEALNVLCRITEKIFPDKNWKDYDFSVNRIKEISAIIFDLI